MDNNKRQDIKISGSGSTGGGIYNDVKISGSGKIMGDIECNEFKASGSGIVEGNIKAKSIKFSGNGHIQGDAVVTEGFDISGSGSVDGLLKAQELSVSGSARIGKGINGGSIKISGSSQIEGSINAQNLSVSGSIKVIGDCEVEEFEAKGSFDIGGLLNGDRIIVVLGGSCYAKEIGGEHIEVKEWGEGLFSFNRILKYFFGGVYGLKSDIIEGDEIYLEYTNAKVVRGNKITIGKGCNIETVEYKEELNVVDDGKIQNSIKQ